MTAAVVPMPVRRVRAPRLRGDERGFGLVELLIALLVLNVGIFATLAAFNAGTLALRRASMASTAGAMADTEMERFRSLTYAQVLAQPASASTTSTGPDGRTYTVESVVSSPASQSTGSGSYSGGRAITVVTVRVHQGASVSGKVLARAVSSFEPCTQDRVPDACGKDPNA